MNGAAVGGDGITIRLTATIVTTTMTGDGVATGMGIAITAGHMTGVGMVVGIVVGATTIDVPISKHSLDSQILSSFSGSAA